MKNPKIQSTLSEEDFPEVGTDYNNDPEQLHIYQRLRSVFQVARIPPMEQQLLKLATLLPETGMDVRLFRKALPSELLRTLPEVGRRGWLSAEQKILTIHPVIRLVCQTELQPTEADCDVFLDKLWEQYDQKQYLPNHYSQMAELFTLAHDRLGRHHGRWLNRSGILWHEVIQHLRLHDLYHTRLPALEQVLPPNSTELATAYNYYGISLDRLGRYPYALKYGEKALTIRKAALPENDADLARSYNNVGSAYERFGNYQKALEYQQKALDIFKITLPPEHPDLATSYNNVGGIYNGLGNHNKALEYHQKALEIWGKILPPDHPDLATSYSNIGNTYGALRNQHKALEYDQKALEIRKKILPPSHPDLARSYNNVGCTYSHLGNQHKALEYQQKALCIWVESLPPDHPDLALSCCNIAWTYHKLGDFINAAQYMHRAANIISCSSLPKTHLRRVYYPKWATEFEKKASMQRKILTQPIQLDHPSLPFPKK